MLLHNSKMDKPHESKPLTIRPRGKTKVGWAWDGNTRAPEPYLLHTDKSCRAAPLGHCKVLKNWFVLVFSQIRQENSNGVTYDLDQFRLARPNTQSSDTSGSND